MPAAETQAQLLRIPAEQIHLSTIIIAGMAVVITEVQLLHNVSRKAEAVAKHTYGLLQSQVCLHSICQPQRQLLMSSSKGKNASRPVSLWVCQDARSALWRTSTMHKELLKLEPFSC